MAAEVRTRPPKASQRWLWRGGEGSSSRSWIQIQGRSNLCPQQFDKSGFSGLSCGRQEEASLALVRSKGGWVGNHPEVCPSRSWAGHVSNSTARERSSSGARAVASNGMKMLVDIGVPDARGMWLEGPFRGTGTSWDRLRRRRGAGPAGGWLSMPEHLPTCVPLHHQQTNRILSPGVSRDVMGFPSFNYQLIFCVYILALASLREASRPLLSL